MPWRAGRSGRLEQLLLVVSLMAVAGLLAERDWLWRWDNLLYDASLPLLAGDAPDDIVIVAIDEASLARLGRWPWSRRTHAALVERLSHAGARVIGLDMLFAEPDRSDPGADDALAASLRDSGRVVLPVVLEPPRSGGQLVERLPLPALSEAAAALGHVHVELDADGLARSVYLREGLGDPRWPAFALAMLRTASPGARPGAYPATGAPTPARVWARDHPVRIPFVGGPGSVAQLSYVQVLEGRYPADAFRDRMVLVGATATGLGDSLPTPVSGYGQPMPGVEINANLLHALRDGDELRAFPAAWRLAICVLLAGVPVLLYARLGPRYGLFAGLGLLAGVLILPTLVMLFGARWFGPAPIAVTLVASYPVWSWLRLETALRYLRQELERLRAQEADTPLPGRPRLKAGMAFLARILPLGGWVLVDADGRRVDGRGREPAAAAPALPPGEWCPAGDALWGSVTAGGREWRIGARWDSPRAPDASERRLLNDLLASQSQRTRHVPADAVEVVQAQIARLEEGHRRLRELQAVIDDGLAQMADAVVVTDALGQVLVANERASRFLVGAPGEKLTGMSLVELLAPVQLGDREAWDDLFRAVLVDGEPRVANARHRDGRDLLIQLAPLARAGRVGLILNASDISELKGSERRRAEMLSFLSHDLRSPLVSVLAVLELARLKGSTDPHLDRVESYTRSTIDLAEQFVELVRAESEEALRSEEVDLVAVAANATEQVWDQATAREVTLESEFTVDDAWVRGDASLLERVLVNLLSNAIRHNPPGTRVRTTVDRDAGGYRVRVRDDGVGIDPADQDRLFERFEQLTPDGAPRRPGSGLGLAFVKVVSDRHGVQVDVDSTPGAGTAFTLHFPA